MEINNISLALVLTILTGLSTGIGSLMPCWPKEPIPPFILRLVFSAGVMIYVSMWNHFNSISPEVGNTNSNETCLNYPLLHKMRLWEGKLHSTLR